MGAGSNEKKLIMKHKVFKNSIQYLDSENRDVQKTVLRILYYISRSRLVAVLKEVGRVILFNG